MGTRMSTHPNRPGPFQTDPARSKPTRPVPARPGPRVSCELVRMLQHGNPRQLLRFGQSPAQSPDSSWPILLRGGVLRYCFLKLAPDGDISGIIATVAGSAAIEEHRCCIAKWGCARRERNRVSCNRLVSSRLVDRWFVVVVVVLVSCVGSLSGSPWMDWLIDWERKGVCVWRILWILVLIPKIWDDFGFIVGEGFWEFRVCALSVDSFVLEELGRWPSFFLRGTDIACWCFEKK